jgi:hypothetical protein
MYRILLVIVLTGLVFVGCDDNDPPRYTINNDSGSMGHRMNYPSGTEKDISIDGPDAPGGVNLVLIAEVFPPVINGVSLQASSVFATDPDKALVSYNIQGAARYGAIDYLSDLIDGTPYLRSSISYQSSEISSVYVETGKKPKVNKKSNWVIGVGASDMNSGDPAVMERIELIHDEFSNNAYKHQLSGYAGTAAIGNGHQMFVASGTSGAVAAFDNDDFASEDSMDFDDARWVAYYKLGTGGKQIAVLQGGAANGTLTILDTDPISIDEEYVVPGVNVVGAKNTVEIARHRAFVAAGPEGVQILDLENGGTILGSISLAGIAVALGLDPADVQANSVTVHGHLMFIGAGGAGVFVAKCDANEFEDYESGDPITGLGRLGFDYENASVNHVVYQDGRLVVAAGLGGVKLVEVQEF